MWNWVCTGVKIGAHNYNWLAAQVAFFGVRAQLQDVPIAEPPTFWRAPNKSKQDRRGIQSHAGGERANKRGGSSLSRRAR